MSFKNTYALRPIKSLSGSLHDMQPNSLAVHPDAWRAASLLPAQMRLFASKYMGAVLHVSPLACCTLDGQLLMPCVHSACVSGLVTS